MRSYADNCRPRLTERGLLTLTTAVNPPIGWAAAVASAELRADALIRVRASSRVAVRSFRRKASPAAYARSRAP
jgi:hypothetical protein